MIKKSLSRLFARTLEVAGYKNLPSEDLVFHPTSDERPAHLFKEEFEVATKTRSKLLKKGVIVGGVGTLLAVGATAYKSYGEMIGRDYKSAAAKEFSEKTTKVLTLVGSPMILGLIIGLKNAERETEVWSRQNSLARNTKPQP